MRKYVFNLVLLAHCISGLILFSTFPAQLGASIQVRQRNSAVQLKGPRKVVHGDRMSLSCGTTLDLPISLRLRSKQLYNSQMAIQLEQPSVAAKPADVSEHAESPNALKWELELAVTGRTNSTHMEASVVLDHLRGDTARVFARYERPRGGTVLHWLHVDIWPVRPLHSGNYVCRMLTQPGGQPIDEHASKLIHVLGTLRLHIFTSTNIQSSIEQKRGDS